MRKIFVILFMLSLGGCRIDDVLPIEVDRALLYHGQTVVSLFDNFGPPDKQSVDLWGIRSYHYNHNSILQRGVDKFAYYCDFVVFTDEGVVIDWYFYGNRCQIRPVEKEFYLE